MIEFKIGNIFDYNTEAIVNTVNCVGVMGRGIALQFKKQFPENYKEYVLACKKKEVQLGKMFIYQTKSMINPKYIINFPTKNHWRAKSRLEDIESGLVDLAKFIQEKKINSITIPPLGCGLGGLKWYDVQNKIKNILDKFTNVQIIVLEPQSAPTVERMVKNNDIPKMTPGRAVLIELIHQYLNGLLDPFVSLLEVHKLLYFMQEAGQDLKLKYKQAYYGPYAENLHHVLNRIEGHFILGYADGGDNPTKKLTLVNDAYQKARQFLINNIDIKARFDRVVKLVDGFEDPYGMELLSTVHWVATKHDVSSKEEIINSIYNWNNRKKRFTIRQITIALDVLKDQNWINNEKLKL